MQLKKHLTVRGKVYIRKALMSI